MKTDFSLRLSLVVPLVLLLCACASKPASERNPEMTPAQLLDDAAFGVSVEDRLTPVDTLAVNDDMRALLREYVPDHLGERNRSERILRAILKDGLQLDYNSFKTYTAEEAFYAREGNCLSFTNLFVALAREAGLKVEYQEVEVPPNWERRGDSYLFNRHINALVSLPLKGKQAVDFNVEEFDVDYPRRRITDNYAKAQYHNNMAIYHLDSGQIRDAYLNLREAISLYPHAAYFWTNLGTLYRRKGSDERAEAAWLYALDLDAEPSAMSSLARLYSAQGEEALADWYGAQVERYRRKNPYYLYELGETAYAGGEFAKAAKLLRKAVHLREDEHEFHRLLGLSYLQLGKSSAARRSFSRAEETATGETQRRQYNQKQRLLAQVNH